VQILKKAPPSNELIPTDNRNPPKPAPTPVAIITAPTITAMPLTIPANQHAYKSNSFI
jgi:hypothetical protein